jgi:hypothetical protein
MQNTEQYELKEEGCSTNQFNSAEYERWSAGITGAESPKTQWGVESFLGISENMPSEREDIVLSLTENRE